MSSRPEKKYPISKAAVSGSVGAVSAIIADAGAEIVTDRTGRGFLRIGGAHGVSPLQDGAFGFEDHAKILPELMKSVSSPKKGPLAMNG